ncbi:MAG: DNA/RNA nuclease SfsA [Deltaproteobacteria bacterium]|nr:DNA/RNA nuclease SfsA [Deltaproteobacteria bacterium]
MKFETPLIQGVLLRRYKRFLADVLLKDGREIRAHTPNTGSMTGCSDPGSEVWVSLSDNPKRKLAYTLELVRAGDTLVGVHTGRANDLAQEAILTGGGESPSAQIPVFPELAGYTRLRREVAYGTGSRVDILLEKEGRPPCYVEVKNVTLAADGAALFPDAVTERGTKHLAELSCQTGLGHRAVMLFVIQREDCSRFLPADRVDPVYGKALRRAVAEGVEVMACLARVSPVEMILHQQVEVVLPPL